MSGGHRKLIFPINERVWDPEVEYKRENNTISIYSHNTYLIPELFVDNGNPTCVDQSRRAKEIGKFAKNFDVVVLQEVWGGCTSQLEAPLLSTHTLLQETKAFSLFGWSSDLFDTAKFYLSRTGGLWFAWMKHLQMIAKWKRTFIHSQSTSGKGVQAILFDASSIWKDCFVLMMNTHLDATHEANKAKQIYEARQFLVHILTNEIPSLFSQTTQTTSSFPPSMATFSFSRCMILFAGDFNINYGSPLYRAVFANLFPELINLYSLYQELDSTRPLSSTTTSTYSHLPSSSSSPTLSTNSESAKTTILEETVSSPALPTTSSFSFNPPPLPSNPSSNSLGFVNEYPDCFDATSRAYTYDPDNNKLACWADSTGLLDHIFTLDYIYNTAPEVPLTSMSNTNFELDDLSSSGSEEDPTRSGRYRRSELEEMLISFGSKLRSEFKSADKLSFARAEVASFEIVGQQPGSEWSDHWPIAAQLHISYPTRVVQFTIPPLQSRYSFQKRQKVMHGRQNRPFSTDSLQPPPRPTISPLSHILSTNHSQTPRVETSIPLTHSSFSGHSASSTLPRARNRRDSF